ncbi:MAG TPA: hypothetical protein VFB74_32065 [Kribbellaceae bacterium]|nr:hypothetical protein [Kribbellaceae bacterium]
MSENSPQGSDDDRVVREILDRVASGELSAADAATLLAGVKNKAEPAADAGKHAGPAAQRPGDAWAAAVDDPRAAASADQPSTGKSGAGASGVDQAGGADTPAGETAAGGTGPVQDVPVQDVPSGPRPVPDPEPAQAEREVEQEVDEHADVPVPAEVQRVVIRAIGRRVRLIGEPAVTGVAVDGPHLIKRDGDTLTVSSDGEMGVSIDGLSMLRTRSVGDLKSHFAKELQVRVNPRLRVEVEVTGGSVTAERTPGLTRVRVTAGTARVTDVSGPIDLLVQAGSANLDAQLTKGRSRVRVESGSANVQLRRGSDVRVHSDAQLGRVTWVGAVNGPSADVEIGQGRAALDVEVLMGAAQITSD